MSDTYGDTRDNVHDRVIALAGILQAAAVVQQIAHSGQAPDTPFQTSINSIFQLDPPDTLSVYGHAQDLKLGLDALHALLKGREADRYREAWLYSRGLINLEKQLRQQPDMLAIIRSRIEAIQQQQQHFDNNLTHPGIISKLADIYVDTLGTFKYRIMVKGDPTLLQRDETATRIRASLLAGIRGVILWRQLGGRRWQFMFNGGAMLEALDQLRHASR